MTTPLPPEWNAWVEVGARLLAAPPLRRSEQASCGPNDPKFALGDFLAGLPVQYLERLAEQLGRDPAQFRIYREVAEKIPAERRVAASWTVHRELRDRPDLLAAGLTLRTAAALLGKKPIDSKADRRLPVEERAARVRAGLADPEVYRVIEAELAREHADRRARRLAGRVVSEFEQRKRELEQEIRDLRTAMSPLEATVKAELRVNEASQLVEAIAQSVDDLPEPERVIRALTELSSVISSFLLSLDHLAAGDGPVIIDADEAWQTRTARAASAGSNQRELPGAGQAVSDQG
jgi:hypothetical protein